ncbi:hypothetical protein ROZALSC1DRAFT_24790 [Rozella allomycis CSF55]|uniref:Uncharacterized protein n=1 Tax=Rozella allomycis (strain CSF55) TaxID=988480 RepID=A0A4P9YC52_ROZAC|nr:hypothetical protein ROZALSC1DRAFT_24790 [Rozella allomycis CSF55]
MYGENPIWNMGIFNSSNIRDITSYNIFNQDMVANLIQNQLKWKVCENREAKWEPLENITDCMEKSISKAYVDHIRRASWQLTQNKAQIVCFCAAPYSLPCVVPSPWGDTCSKVGYQTPDKAYTTPLTFINMNITTILDGSQRCYLSTDYAPVVRSEINVNIRIFGYL